MPAGDRKRLGASAPATLQLVRPSTPSPSEPLARLEAEAMRDCVARCRPILTRLPYDSKLREQWLGACDDAMLAAQLSWPSLRDARPVSIVPDEVS